MGFALELGRPAGCNANPSSDLSLTTIQSGLALEESGKRVALAGHPWFPSET